MNWLDMLLIIINIICIVFGIISIPLAVKNTWGNWDIYCITFWVSYIFFGWVLWLLPFIVLDKGSGSTIGTITSVDSNFFGTTALFIKTSENTQEEYCIEDDKIAKASKELIGKNVKIEYGTRVGLYSTGKCHQAPVENIIELTNKEK